VAQLTSEYLWDEYVIKERSTYDIATECSTYPNKVLRALKKFGIPRRDKSKAQAIAIKTGRHQHPTEGKPRSEDVKIKISEAVAKIWKSMDEATKQRRITLAQEQWEKMPDDKKEELRRLASEAVRKAADEGSKLEKFLLIELQHKGYKVTFHQEHIVSREGLQVDLLLPELKVAIEVDGPTHFLPIWGEANLAKHILSDNRKTGLLLNAGYVLIRIKYLIKTMSKIHERTLLAQIIECLQSIEKSFPPITERLIELEVKND
jgi:very-short-patch-repair endonuclease